MRFSSLLFALPLVGSVLAAPLAKVERDLALVAVEKRDLDVLSILADVEAKVKVLSGDVTAVVDVSADINICITALTSCLDALSVNADIAAAVGITATKRDFVELDTRGLDVNAVAQILVSITASISDYLGGVDASVLADVNVSALVSSCDGLIANVFVGIKVLLPSILSVCASLFVSLHININVCLSGVLNLVGGLVGGLLDTVLGIL